MGNRLDRFRLYAAMLVVAIHISPLVDVGSDADFFLTRIFARMAVPFFLMVTGQFVLPDLFSPNMEIGKNRLYSYLKKIGLLYGTAIAIYLPIGVYAGHYSDLSFWGILRMLLFDGTFYHLWYFPACMMGVSLLFLLSRFASLRAVTVAAGCLYLMGLFGDSYYGFIQNFTFIGQIYKYMFRLFSYTRNGLFLAPIFLMLGFWVGQKKNISACTDSVDPYDPIPKCHKPAGILWAVGFVASFCLMTAEGFWLHGLGVQRHDSMYLMLVPTMIFLYCLLSQRDEGASRTSKTVREVSTWVYILHPAIMIVVRLMGKAFHLTALLVGNRIVYYFTVLGLSFAGAYALCAIKGLAGNIADIFQSKGSENSSIIDGRPHVDYAKGRAWIELDRDALEKNVRFLQSRLPKGCELMPAIKANAYGHGAVFMGRELNQLGIRAFCVASVKEGVELRRNKVKGEILILGYTHPRQFHLLCKYHLTQTIIDYDYACLLERFGKKIHVHIGVDTGMHRLGEPWENTENICKLFHFPHLAVDGVFTHLSSAGADTPEARDFTRNQASSFYQLAEILGAKRKEEGRPIPKLHIQSSYGVLNYPELGGDYARVGIALYGVLSTKEDTEKWSDKLTPVLSLKARVASVRMLPPGAGVGYDRAFVAQHEMKIAVVTIGYGDGLPRSLSNGVGCVLIKGQKAPIIGKICMDQTIVDVSHIPEVKAGNMAVVIGTSGNESISAADLAAQAGTITNEILSRLGRRVEGNISP